MYYNNNIIIIKIVHYLIEHITFKTIIHCFRIHLRHNNKLLTDCAATNLTS